MGVQVICHQLPAHILRDICTPIQPVIMGAPMSSFSVDAPEKAFLNEHDFTAVSFWIISIAMIAATVFFYAEAATVTSHWKTSLHVEDWSHLLLQCTICTCVSIGSLSTGAQSSTGTSI